MRGSPICRARMTWTRSISRSRTGSRDTHSTCNHTSSLIYWWASASVTIGVGEFRRIVCLSTEPHTVAPCWLCHIAVVNLGNTRWRRLIGVVIWSICSYLLLSQQIIYRSLPPAHIENHTNKKRYDQSSNCNSNDGTGGNSSLTLCRDWCSCRWCARSWAAKSRGGCTGWGRKWGESGWSKAIACDRRYPCNGMDIAFWWIWFSRREFERGALRPSELLVECKCSILASESEWYNIATFKEHTGLITPTIPFWHDVGAPQ